MAGHVCGFARCTEPATALMVDMYHDHPLFQHGAGLVCEQHARECEDKGVRVKIPRDVRRRMRLG